MSTLEWPSPLALLTGPRFQRLRVARRIHVLHHVPARSAAWTLPAQPATTAGTAAARSLAVTPRGSSLVLTATEGR